MQCPRPRTLMVAARKGESMRPMMVACQECPTCRLARRAQRAAVGTLEGMHVREKYGPGFIWMGTLTYDDANLPYHEPRPHDLYDWLPQLGAPRNDSRASLFKYGPDRYFDQLRRMKGRYGMSSAEVRKVREGTYARVPELRPLDVERWLARCRKLFKVRVFWAGEYGSATGRPHYHVIAYGVSREQFRMMLREWKHGNTDPAWDTWTGSQLLDRQYGQNQRPGAAAMYITLYLTKDETYEMDAAMFARQHAFTRSVCKPGLGYAYAEMKLAPRWRREYDQALREYSALPEHWAGVLAAYHAQAASAAIKVDEWWYVLSRDFRRRFLAVAGIPEAHRVGAQEFAVQVQQDRTAMRMGDGVLAKEYAAELEALKAKEAEREARYLRSQEKREAEWKKVAGGAK